MVEMRLVDVLSTPPAITFYTGYGSKHMLAQAGM